jgi:hypothetical protein
MPLSPPNRTTPGNRANGSFAQPRGANGANPPNSRSDGRTNDNGTSLSGGANGMNPPNSTSNGMTMTSQPGSAVRAGQGAVAVNPGYNGPSTAPDVIQRGR